jgi:hypothetical protein
LTPAERRAVLRGLTRTEKLTVLRSLEEAAKEQRRGTGARYVQFKRTYRDDPAAFVMDCIDWSMVKNSSGPANYQLEILSEIPRSGRVSARGPHGLGKTAIESWVVLWFALTSDGEDWKALTTASAWRQLTVYLWPEIHKWSRMLKWEVIGRAPFIEKVELLDRNLKLLTGAASSVASSDHGKIEGAHADRLLFAYDEAKIIPDATWDASDGAFSTGECYGLAVSTPGPPQGRFYDIHSKKLGFQHWWTRHVTLDEAIEAGRINAEWAEDMKLQWGQDSALYRNRVLGEFAESSADGIVPLIWVEEAVERWHEAAEGQRPALDGVGADIGESDDPTVLAPKYGEFIDELLVLEGLDTMKSAKAIEEFIDSSGNPRAYAVVDAIGIGSGVVARLREDEYRVVAFVASEKSTLKDETDTFGFANKRAEAWWNLREMLDPSKGATLCLPPDSKLLGELTAPKYQEVAGARIKVESKEEIRKRLDGRSTDRADAVIQICNERPATLGDGIVSVSKRRSPRRKSVWRTR